MKSPTIKSQIQYFNNNETQFTFLVFEKSLVDTFFLSYKPLLYSNEKLKKAFADSLLIQKFDDNALRKAEGNIQKFSSNTQKPDINSFNLAIDVLNATLTKGGEKYFSGSLHYLFFYDCLPLRFRHKWTQTSLGHFEFNVTFFALLRANSKELDSLIYGNIGYWNEDMQTLFSEYIFNEITPEVAEKIKNTILNDNVFDDKKFLTDRTNFLEFLNKTISKEWRLVLIDWD